uniref:Uncharacterized protein n=1 Tax=Anguilla anguilla TaxID=7936 RepID=A0A0E9XH27_ANGAN
MDMDYHRLYCLFHTPVLHACLTSARCAIGMFIFLSVWPNMPVFLVLMHLCSHVYIFTSEASVGFFFPLYVRYLYNIDW